MTAVTIASASDGNALDIKVEVIFSALMMMCAGHARRLNKQFRVHVLAGIRRSKSRTIQLFPATLFSPPLWPLRFRRRPHSPEALP